MPAGPLENLSTACDRLAATGQVDQDDPLTALCPKPGPQLTVICFFEESEWRYRRCSHSLRIKINRSLPGAWSRGPGLWRTQEACERPLRSIRSADVAGHQADALSTDRPRV